MVCLLHETEKDSLWYPQTIAVLVALASNWFSSVSALENALAQPQRSIASQPYGLQTKMEGEKPVDKKTITATTECVLNHISSVLVFFFCCVEKLFEAWVTLRVKTAWQDTVICIQRLYKHKVQRKYFKKATIWIQHCAKLKRNVSYFNGRMTKVMTHVLPKERRSLFWANFSWSTSGNNTSYIKSFYLRAVQSAVQCLVSIRAYALTQQQDGEESLHQHCLTPKGETFVWSQGSVAAWRARRTAFSADWKHY